LRNLTQKAFVLLLISAFCASVGAAPQEDVVFKLANGIEVVHSRAAGIPYFTAVLVCPLPPVTSDADRAAAAMLNRLLWSGGEGFGTSIKEYEYGMIALRFNGSIGSQLTPDAMLIQFTMPTEHMDSVFKYMAMQWTSLQITDARLESARRKVIEEERAGITSSVFNQLMREIEPRLWSDIDYRFRGTGAAVLRGIGEEQIRLYQDRMRSPANWTLFIAGDVDSPRLHAILDETLATIGPSDATAGERQDNPVAQAPQLGVRLQLPAELSQRHAVTAYRLPAPAGFDTAALLLLARYLNNAPAVEELRKALGANSQVSIGFDLRRQAGIIYFYAAWDENPALGDVAARLAGIAEAVPTTEIDIARLEQTRKTLLIDYWTRRQATQPYALWRAGRIAVGLADDDLREKLQKLGATELKSTAAQLLKRENRINLVTVPK
jgi:predicted Zn-dependent peptidase